MGLIVGGNGYIGTALRTVLEADVADAGWYGQPRQVDSMARHDWVMWLAAHASVWLCENDPLAAWVNNVAIFRAAVNALRDDQVLIYASTGSVYGSTDGDAVEDMALGAPLTNYDMHKMVVDIVASKAIAEGKQVIGLRFGTLAGFSPHCRTDIMVNSMVWDAITMGCLSVSNRDKRRGLLFLPDLANAVQAILADPVPGIYNLASINTTVGHVADTVADLLEAEQIDSEHVNPFSFGLSCAKFEATYGPFRTTTLDEVVAGLAAGLPTAQRSRRDQLP